MVMRLSPSIWLSLPSSSSISSLRVASVALYLRLARMDFSSHSVSVGELPRYLDRNSSRVMPASTTQMRMMERSMARMEEIF